MDKKKLEVWANLLLDTGKRNNLINFKGSSVSSAEVILPDGEALLAKAETGAKFEVYDPVGGVEPFEEEPEEAYEESYEGTYEGTYEETYAESYEESREEAPGELPDKEIDDSTGNPGLQPIEASSSSDVFAEISSEPVIYEEELLAGNAEEADPEIPEETGEEETAPEETAPEETTPEEMVREETVREKKEPAPRERYVEKYSKKIRRAGQMLLYNSAEDPARTVKNIAKKSQSVTEETGVNVAYLAFGFVCWKEQEQEYRAPLLLVPVTFTNASALDPWYLHMTGDGVIVNPTFSFKLKAEYGTPLPVYEDEGLAAYLAKTEKMIERTGWRVENSVQLGIFSFLKLNMYQDLMLNMEKIVENPNVRALLGEPWEISDLVNQVEDAPEEENKEKVILHNVVNADSSQLEAIRMAKAGKSFVLQGPPGTGKSQTITNIIAECLSDGKRVLFVSEKMAALNVVYDKLKKAGLEEFCLELHSYKANKREVVQNLCRTLRTPKTAVSERAGDEIARNEAAREELDQYAEALHEKQPVIECSLFDLYNDYSAARSYPDTGTEISDIEERTAADREECAELLEEYARFIPATGYDYRNHIWYGYQDPDTSWTNMKEVRSDFEKVTDGVTGLLPQCDLIREKLSLQVDSLKDMTEWKEFFLQVPSLQFVTPKLFTKSVFSRTEKLLPKLREHGEAVTTLEQDILKNYDAGVLALPGEDFHKKLEKLYSGFFSRLTGSEYKEMIRSLRLCRNDGKKPSYEEALQITKKLTEHQALSAAFAETEAPVKELFGKGYKGAGTDWGKLADECFYLRGLFHDGFSFGTLADWSTEEFYEHQPEMERIGEKLDASLSRFAAERGHISGRFEKEVFDTETVPVTELLEKISGCLTNFEQAESYCRLQELIRKIRDQKLEGFLQAELDAELSAEQLSGSFRRSFAHRYIDAIIRKTPALTSFSRISHDRVCEIFHAKDETRFAISKVQIKAALSAERPNLDMITNGSATQKLLREGEKKRNLMPIRRLLDETGELVQRIKPCFLMSPLSVSTYLTSNKIRFDVVIFDEASQIFPQDAVGAVYRAKQLIVVGDSRQMPPTNFFNTAIEVEGDEETGDVADFESILDICTASLRQLRLKWHYRSRYEDLIAFSNQKFYDNDLVTFPSAAEKKPDIGVDYIHVDGLFEHKARINRIEAKRVVELIMEHIDHYPDRSLGVVAFSIAQQDYIERLLLKARREDPSREDFFRGDSREPFFIKNLETVQGDERDTIIFSVAYGKDPDGKLLYNFGPLGKEGGERRLNVAVTRAKKNIKLVTSLHSAELDPSRTTSRGAAVLRAYLEYAELGANAVMPTGDTGFESETQGSFDGEIREFLTEHGFVTETKVGCSECRIDLAVKDPEKGNYLLAIESDGETYHSAKTARDRDWLRQSVLEGMGWQYARVWSTEWFKNQENEKQHLLKAAEAALAAAKEPEAAAEAEDTAENVSEASSEDISTAAEETGSAEENGSAEETVPEETALEDVFEEEVKTEGFVFPVYQKADEKSCFTGSGSFLTGVRRVLDVEAPLSEEALLKRIHETQLGYPKLTQTAKTAFSRMLAGCENWGIERRNGFLFLKDKPVEFRTAGEERRDIKEISLEELAAGMKKLVDDNISMSREALFRHMAKLLGFSRIGDAMEGRLAEALELLAGEISIDGEHISVKEHETEE